MDFSRELRRCRIRPKDGIARFSQRIAKFPSPLRACEGLPAHMPNKWVETCSASLRTDFRRSCKGVSESKRFARISSIQALFQFIDSNASTRDCLDFELFARQFLVAFACDLKRRRGTEIGRLFIISNSHGFFSTLFPNPPAAAGRGAKRLHWLFRPKRSPSPVCRIRATGLLRPPLSAALRDCGRQLALVSWSR